MSYYLYSAEDFPAKRQRNPVFSDTPEYIRYNNFVVYGVKAHEWVKLERKYERIEFTDSFDKRGNRVIVLEEEMAEAINNFFRIEESSGFGRGVIVVDEQTYHDEGQRKLLGEMCESENREFRARQISAYEMGLQERQVTGKGRAYPTPYEEECYKILDMPRPMSAEALRAIRRPGEAVRDEIVSALRESAASLARAQGPGAFVPDSSTFEAPVSITTDDKET